MDRTIDESELADVEYELTRLRAQRQMRHPEVPLLSEDTAEYLERAPADEASGGEVARVLDREALLVLERARICWQSGVAMQEADRDEVEAARRILRAIRNRRS